MGDPPPVPTVKAAWSVTAAQRAGIRAEAFRRTTTQGRRVTESEVVREHLDSPVLSVDDREFLIWALGTVADVRARDLAERLKEPVWPPTP